eukprot:g46938.t1
MDTEEGVEVVWNEVQFSERKNFKLQEDKVKAVFDNLIQLEHLNIVKFHKYWADVKENKARKTCLAEIEKVATPVVLDRSIAGQASTYCPSLITQLRVNHVAVSLESHVGQT